MAYDKKLLAAARRELERERTAHTEELEARRRDIYTREPRIRAIDRELSTTAASVLRAAMESGGDPTAAIEKLRDRNLGLQEERGGLLRQLGLPADYLTDKPLCPKCGDTGYAGSATCECVKARYAKLLKEQLSSVLPIADQNFSKFDMSFYSTVFDVRAGALVLLRQPGTAEKQHARVGSERGCIVTVCRRQRRQRGIEERQVHVQFGAGRKQDFASDRSPAGGLRHRKHHLTGSSCIVEHPALRIY